MNAFKPLVPALLLALALPATAAAQKKVFIAPTTATNSVSPCGSGYDDLTLDIANEAAAKLAQGSVQTQVQAAAISTQTSTSTAAVEAANLWGADGYVAMNLNSGGGHGPETYYYTGSTTGADLATAIQTQLVAAYPLPNRGIKENSTWYVLKYTDMPATASFLLFADCATAHPTLPGSVTEAAYVCTASGRDTIGLGFGAGVCDWLGVSCSGSSCVPTAEVCDGQDNDCDGTADDGNPGGGSLCTTGSPGACSPGIERCVSGALVCQASATPTTETCNGIDDDCDGTVDDGIAGVGATCQTGDSGICAAGTRRCVGGSLICQPNAAATVESCNGTDDDCDGQTDEENPGGGQSCSTGGVGECGRGTTACQGGQITCIQSGLAGEEICDGKDNDCDGQTDEGNPGAGELCATGLRGVCGIGKRACTSGSLTCVPDVQPSAELCDGLDNDCDGVTDEEISGGVCSTGLPGACGQGAQRCVGATLSCVQTVQPSAESCDGIDNDCNGRIDDAPGCPGAPDAGSADAGATADAGAASDAGQAGADAGTADAGEAGEAGEPTPGPESGCGCAAGPDGSGLLAIFALAGLLRRRRR